MACDQELVKYVTFRARLRGTHENSSEHLVSLLTDWISTGPVIKIMGLLMTVEKNCITKISSFNEQNCIPEDHYQDPITNDGFNNNDSPNPAIAGAVTGAFGLVGAMVVSLITTYCCHNKHCKNVAREKGKQTVVENKTVHG